MVARSILKWPSIELLKKAEVIQIFDENVIQLAKDLRDTMKVNFGAGLAATQINDNRSAFVVTPNYAPSFPSDPNLEDAIFVANPVIKTKSDDVYEWPEACLSVENVQAKVSRHKDIELTYQNTVGEHILLVLSDEESATIQHEFDHLIGKLFIHRLSGLRRSMILRKLKKAHRKKKSQEKTGMISKSYNSKAKKRKKKRK